MCVKCPVFFAYGVIEMLGFPEISVASGSVDICWLLGISMMLFFPPCLYVLCLFPLSGVLCSERVDGVVRLCRALQGNSPQAEQDHPAGAA